MKRALKIEVPAEEVNQRFIRAYTELNKQMSVSPVFTRQSGSPYSKSDTQRRSKKDVIRSLFLIITIKRSNKPKSCRFLVEIPPLERVKIQKDGRH